MGLFSIILYGWLFVSSILCVFFAFVIMITYKWIKPIMGAKFSKDKSLELVYNRDGSATFSSLKRSKKTFFDNEGESFQEYKVDDKEKKLTPLFHVINGLRLFSRRENDLTAIDESGKPAPVDQSWLNQYVERDRQRVLLRKKLFKKKAFDFPIAYLVIIIIGIIVAYLAFTFFA
jgi:hypothetical protein